MIVPVWGVLILLGVVREGIVGNATKLGGWCRNESKAGSSNYSMLGP
jgi:hypothetical protein